MLPHHKIYAALEANGYGRGGFYVDLRHASDELREELHELCGTLGYRSGRKEYTAKYFLDANYIYFDSQAEHDISHSHSANSSMLIPADKFLKMLAGATVARKVVYV